MLPQEILVSIFGLFLRGLPASHPVYAHFGAATFLLKQLVILSCVHSTWRMAAARFFQAPRKTLAPRSHMRPVYLSTLLAELVCGVGELRMGWPLMDSPEAAGFIKAVAPGRLLIAPSPEELAELAEREADAEEEVAHQREALRPMYEQIQRYEDERRNGYWHDSPPEGCKGG